MSFPDFDESLAKCQIERLIGNTDVLSMSRLCTKMNISAQNISLLAEGIAAHICELSKQQRLGKLLYTYVQLEMILQELEKITQQYHL